jgi:phosphatidylinositol N-acetylglucosaminyltransferase subunit A
VLNRGHIFINTSISEAFCIAVLEAVACGLKVVTTDVGGIPEILPTDMVVLAKPNAEDLTEKLEQAIANYNDFSPSEFNERVNKFYKWRNVAERTETVYYKVMLKGDRSSLDLPRVFYENQNYFLVGMIFYAIMYLIKLLLDIFRPVSSIEKAREFPHKKYWENPESFGSH